MKGEEVIGVLALCFLGLAVVMVPLVLPREEEEVPPEPPPQEPEIIDAVLRSGDVYWAGEPAWKEVHTRWPNSWPADTDISFAWKIKNTGDTGAYFQVYIFDPGDWFYLGPGEETTIYEDFHTPVLTVTPGYQYVRITILGRRLDGERVGAVWTSEEFEVSYV